MAYSRTEIIQWLNWFDSEYNNIRRLLTEDELYSVNRAYDFINDFIDGREEQPIEEIRKQGHYRQINPVSLDYKELFNIRQDILLKQLEKVQLNYLPLNQIPENKINKLWDRDRAFRLRYKQNVIYKSLLKIDNLPTVEQYFTSRYTDINSKAINKPIERRLDYLRGFVPIGNVYALRPLKTLYSLDTLPPIDFKFKIVRTMRKQWAGEARVFNSSDIQNYLEQAEPYLKRSFTRLGSKYHLEEIKPLEPIIRRLKHTLEQSSKMFKGHYGDIDIMVHPDDIDINDLFETEYLNTVKKLFAQATPTDAMQEAWEEWIGLDINETMLENYRSYDTKIEPFINVRDDLNDLIVNQWERYRINQDTLVQQRLGTLLSTKAIQELHETNPNTRDTTEF